MMTETRWARLSWHAREKHIARLRANVEQARRAHEAWKIAQGITRPEPEPEPEPESVRSSELVLEEVQHLTRYGVPAESICERLGLTPSAIAQSLYRAGRPDLAPPFRKIERAGQFASCADCDGPCDKKATRCRPCATKARVAA